MSELLFVAAILLLTLEGLIVCRLRAVAEMDVAGRLAVAFAIGIVLNTLLLSAQSAIGIGWSRLACWIPAAMLATAGIIAARRCQWRVTMERGWIPIAAILLLMLYGAVTSRLTSGDLLFFWGPKAVRFAEAGKIDVCWLGDGTYYLAHPDYPPLIPLTDVWGIIAAKKMSWSGALLLLPVTIFAAVAAFRGFARPTLGDERSLLYALLMTAVLCASSAVAMVGGAADMMLVFFEVVALSALTFSDDAHVIAAIALLGCVMTKVEGASLAAIVVFAFFVTRRRVVAAIAIFAPAATFLAVWVWFAHRFGLTDSYSTGGRALHIEKLGLVLRTVAADVSYESYYLPWIGAIAPIATGRKWSRAALPLIVALGLVASTTWFYLHAFRDATDYDPTYWIHTSASRVLLTALAAFVVATAAANE